MPLSDESSLLLQLSDPSARKRVFEEVVSEYSEPLYWKIRTIVGNHDDADDVLQNTFLKAWRNLDGFEGRSQLSTWLYRIAVNESLCLLRHRRLQEENSAPLDDSMVSDLSADVYFNGNRLERLLQEALYTLPPVQRTVFSLRYYQEMKYNDMSVLLNTSTGSLKASYHIAVKKIKTFVLGRLL